MAINRLKDPPTRLKVATTLEPPGPAHCLLTGHLFSSRHVCVFLHGTPYSARSSSIKYQLIRTSSTHNEPLQSLFIWTIRACFLMSHILLELICGRKVYSLFYSRHVFLHGTPYSARSSSMKYQLLHHTWVWNRGICKCVIVRPRSHMLIVLKKVILDTTRYDFA